MSTDLDEARQRIASRLRSAREMAGLSQGQVAEILGIHRPTISEIEAGRRKVASEELLRFAEVYRVSAVWLLDEQDEEDSDPHLQLAARELSRVSSEDLDRLLKIIRAVRTRKSSEIDQ